MSNYTKRLSLLAMLFTSSTCFAIEDTKANREREADRYLSLIPLKQMYEDMVAHAALELPLKERKAFVRESTKLMDAATLAKGVRESVTKCLTAAEIGALADFYSTNLGWSAMVKIGPCSNAVMMRMLEQQLRR